MVGTSILGFGDDDESESKEDSALILNHDNSSDSTSITSFFIENNVYSDDGSARSVSKMKTPFHHSMGSRESMSSILGDDCDPEWVYDLPDQRNISSSAMERLRESQKKAQEKRNFEEGKVPELEQKVSALTTGRDVGGLLGKSMDDRNPNGIVGKASKGQSSQLGKAFKKGISSRGLQKAFNKMTRYGGSGESNTVNDDPSTMKEISGPFDDEITDGYEADGRKVSPSVHLEDRRICAKDSIARPNQKTLGVSSRRALSRHSLARSTRSMGSEDLSRLINDDDPVPKRSLSCENLMVDYLDDETESFSVTANGQSKNRKEDNDGAQNDQSSQLRRKSFIKSKSSKGLQKAFDKVSKRRVGRSSSGVRDDEDVSVTPPLPSSDTADMKKGSLGTNEPSRRRASSRDKQVDSQAGDEGQETSTVASRIRGRRLRPNKSMGSEDLSHLVGGALSFPARSLSYDNLMVEPFDDDDISQLQSVNSELSKSEHSKSSFYHQGKLAKQVFKKMSRSTRKLLGTSSKEASLKNRELDSSSQHSKAKRSVQGRYDGDGGSTDRGELPSVDRQGKRIRPALEDPSDCSHSQIKTPSTYRSNREGLNGGKESIPSFVHAASLLFSSKTCVNGNESVSNISTFSVFSSHSDEKYCALDESMSSFAHDSVSSFGYDDKDESLVESSVNYDSMPAQFESEALPIPTNHAAENPQASSSQKSNVRNCGEEAVICSNTPFFEDFENETVCSPEREISLLNSTGIDGRLSAPDMFESRSDDGQSVSSSPYLSSPEDQATRCHLESRRDPRKGCKSASGRRDFRNGKLAKENQSDDSKQTQRQESCTKKSSRSQRKKSQDSQDSASVQTCESESRRRSSSVHGKRTTQKRTKSADSESGVRSQNDDESQSHCSSRGRRERRMSRTKSVDSESEFRSQNDDESQSSCSSSGRKERRMSSSSRSKSSKDLMGGESSLRQKMHRQPSRRRVNKLGYALPLDYNVKDKEALKKTKSDRGLGRKAKAANSENGGDPERVEDNVKDGGSDISERKIQG